MPRNIWIILLLSIFIDKIIKPADAGNQKSKGANKEIKDYNEKQQQASTSSGFLFYP